MSSNLRSEQPRSADQKRARAEFEDYELEGGKGYPCFEAFVSDTPVDIATLPPLGVNWAKWNDPEEADQDCYW
jgi:hypothetical protein